jgi:hypothetical protein
MRPLSDCAIHTYSHDLARPRRTLQGTQACSRQVSKRSKNQTNPEKRKKSLVDPGRHFPVPYTSSYQFVPLVVKTRKRITGTSERTESERGRSRARTRPRVRTASTQTIVKASSTAHQHVHARPAVGITSTDSWYALTVALKRIQRITLAAQNTARCAKRPVIDRSVARARTASVASAKKLDTRLENAERETFAPLRMTPMRKVSMMLTIRMPTMRRWPKR